MVSWPPERIGEALIDGQWVRLPLRGTSRITITRGLGAEGTSARPGSLSVRVNDPEAVHSPRNVESDLYGKWGQGSQFRFRVGDVPEAGAALMTDTFNRTSSNGWGTATSGQTWSIWDPAGSSPPASDFSVSPGAGKFTVTALNSSRWITTSGVSLSDFEATFTIATSTVPSDDTAEEGVLMTFAMRLNRTAITLYYIDIELLPNIGLPNGAGMRVSMTGYRADTTITPAITPYQQIPALTYAAGSPLRVRVRAEGPEIRARIWPDGTTEPDHWHLQAYDTAYTAGEIGFRGSVRGDLTTTPVTMSVGDLTIRPLAAAPDTVRMVGEAASLEPYEGENGPDSGYVDVEAAGALRRYDGTQKPLRSAMRRRVGAYGAQAYWSFEEGARGDVSVAETGDQSTTGPLAVSGLEFARDSTLPGSGPLPTAKAGATLRSGLIPGEATGFWAVYAFVRIPAATFPTSGTHQILSFSTGSATYNVYAQSVSTVPTIVLGGTDNDGTDLGASGITNTQLVAAGLPGIGDTWLQIKVWAFPSGSNTVVRLGVTTPGYSGLSIGLAAAALSADRVRRITTVVGSGMAGMSIGHLAVFGAAHTTAFTSANAYGLADLDLSWPLGAPGLRARDWLTALAVDQAAALDSYGPGRTLLGGYTTDSFVSLARAAAETDLGLLVERRAGVGLEYYSREWLYNRPVALVLDYSSGMVFAPFQPKDDDKGLINKLTVRRKGGSEATVEVAVGRRSTQAPPVGVGIKDGSQDTIVQSDRQLPDQAGWRLHESTVDQMRVTSVTLKMANPRLRNLLDTVLALREGSRVQIVNVPKRYGPDGFDLLVRGTKEVHAEGVFDITLNCTPYEPYVVGGRRYFEDFEDDVFALPYASGGNAAWTRSTAHFNNGTTSLRSGTITNNQTSDAVFTLPSGARELRFWYWTSSEAAGAGFAGDRLLVLVDGVQVLIAQGTTGWTQHVVDVTGRTTLTFRYAKDNSASSGEDAVHVDDISVTGVAPSRRDTGGSRLAADVSATATSLSVETVLGPVWTQDPVHFPFNARLGGEVVTVLAVTGATSPQTWTVRRSVNGAVKRQLAGTAVSLAAPAIRAL
jgi:hypothetical protein